ncbi:hypothetical protein [Streptomyces sp. NPDC014734]|uniref:hypothetical protein n=1 Tax=Streptomyces sp. NPDC014734 TaxID=3364886 RepID=UPI0036F9025C
MNGLTGKWITVIATALSASATVLSGPALAASQFPSANKDGIRLDWSADWESAHRLENITLQLCDATPGDKSRATVQLQAYVTRGGAARIETAPTVFQVPIGDKACMEWRRVFLTYSQDQDRLAYARAQIYTSEKPKEKFWTKWVKNPFLGG